MAKDVLLKLATKATLSVLIKFERKIIWRGAVRARKKFTLFISNEDTGDIRIVRSLENFLVLLYLFNNIEITKYFNDKPRFNDVFFQKIAYVD